MSQEPKKIRFVSVAGGKSWATHMIAFEAGYRACEKGLNLQAAMEQAFGSGPPVQQPRAEEPDEHPDDRVEPGT